MVEDLGDVHKLGKELGYLPYMIDRYLSLLGEEETINLLSFNETTLAQSIRLNSLRNPIEKTEELLKQKQVIMEHVKNLPEARKIIESPIPIGASEEYLNGYYTLQGLNSLFPSKILNPKEGELIADLAAAPGGKTTHLAQIMKNKGTIIALARMGVENTIIVNMDAQNIVSLGLKFDKILLDAPCSGSGIIVTDSSRKSSKTIYDLFNYHKLQVSLLTNAIKVLKNQGEIVYSTCSLEPEENELVITEVLKSTSVRIEKMEMVGDNGLERFQTNEFHPDLIKAKRLYPHKSCGEGFFIVKMVKQE